VVVGAVFLSLHSKAEGGEEEDDDDDEKIKTDERKRHKEGGI